MRLTRPLVVATVLAGMLAAAPAAVAGTPHTGPAMSNGHVRPPVDGLAPITGTILPDAVQQTSRNWAGWVDNADTNVELRFVSATFKVPTITCTSFGPTVSIWVGLDGFQSKTVEQAGIDAACDIQGPDGVLPQYVSWYERYPRPANFKGALSPGDSVGVSVFFDSSTGNYDMAVNDPSSPGADIGVAFPCPSGSSCRNSSAEVIAEDAGGGPAKGFFLPKFSPVTFTGVAVTSRDGTHGTLEGNSLWSAHQIFMEYPNNTIMAEPSARADGATSFTVTYKSAG